MGIEEVGADGSPVKDFKVTLQYPKDKKVIDTHYILKGLATDVIFEKQEDGPWRSEELLPDEEFTVFVRADGFKPKSERLKLPEGAIKELEVKLEKQ